MYDKEVGVNPMIWEEFTRMYVWGRGVACARVLSCLGFCEAFKNLVCEVCLLVNRVRLHLVIQRV